MSCAACSARVESAVSKVEGVTSCSVNLLTNSMGVEGTASSEDIINAVKKAGYSANIKGDTKSVNSENVNEKDKFKGIKIRLIWSVILLVILMYFSMGHTMWGFRLPEELSKNPMSIGLIQLLLSALIMVINQKFFINGFKGLINRSPNMDTLVALGSAAAFIYSCWALFSMSSLLIAGETSSAFHQLHDLYFESAAMVLTLVTVGKLLEEKSKGKTTNAIKSLIALAPKTANVLREGEEISVVATDVKIGDIFIVRPGESIAVDGIVTKGESAVDESSLTGESIPVDKKTGDNVSSGTINQSGVLYCKALRVGEDTTLSQIIKIVSDAAATKAPIAKIAHKVSGVFVPVVIILALITFFVWFMLGQSFGFALARAISVLVISCPCALGLATPVAIMVGSGVGAKNGILFKTAASLEAVGKTQIIALDKTGTITLGLPKVTDVIPAYEEKERLISVAVSLEKNSEHPLAKAITEYSKEKGIKPLEIENFKSVSGNGLKGLLNDSLIYGGNAQFVSENITIPSDLLNIANSLASQGKTPLYFAENDKLLGIIAVADTVKQDSSQAIEQMKNMGIKVVMLTGDNERTANAIGKIAGVDEVYADTKPQDKGNIIKNLQQKGKVTMVGDGINDAPALTVADMGIAIGTGADVAIDAADVVVMKSRLTDVAAAIRLSRRVLTNIKQNLFWAFGYNLIGIPLAAGLFINNLRLELNPMFAAACMSFSSFFVVSNALRLNFIKIYNSKRDKKIRHKRMKKIMKKTIKIEGMMCPHCEATVKKALEGIDGVAQADVSHKEGIAQITLSFEVNDEILKQAVEAKDFKVTDII